jgi:serine/threonine protein kinase
VFACKVIDKRNIAIKFAGLLEQFYVEIQVLRCLNHPNIIHLEDVFETNDRIYMASANHTQEACADAVTSGHGIDAGWGTFRLRSRKRVRERKRVIRKLTALSRSTLSEEEASILVRKITSAVAHMHNQNIIHRDLKPENLLLTNKAESAEIKIIDFGLAKIMQDSVARSFLGTRGYLAPEMLQRHSYDKAIDIWALGVIVFVLLCGCLPFDDDSSRLTSDSAVKEKFMLRFPRWAQNLSSSAKDLLVHLLDVNPRSRYTAEQALNHPWVAGKNVSKTVMLQSPRLMRDLARIQATPTNPESTRALAQRQRQQGATTTTYGSPLDTLPEEQHAPAHSVQAQGKSKSSRKKKATASGRESYEEQSILRKNSI